MKNFTLLFALIFITFIPSFSNAEVTSKDRLDTEKQNSKAIMEWHYPWAVALQNEQAVADLKSSRILLVKCDAGKQLYDNLAEVKKDCEESTNKFSKAENNALFQRYASLELIANMKDKDDKLSTFLRKLFSKQVTDLEEASFLKQDDPEQYQVRWKKLVNSIQSGEFFKTQTP